MYNSSGGDKGLLWDNYFIAKIYIDIGEVCCYQGSLLDPGDYYYEI